MPIATKKKKKTSFNLDGIWTNCIFAKKKKFDR